MNRSCIRNLQLIAELYVLEIHQKRGYTAGKQAWLLGESLSKFGYNSTARRIYQNIKRVLPEIFEKNPIDGSSAEIATELLYQYMRAIAAPIDEQSRRALVSCSDNVEVGE